MPPFQFVRRSGIILCLASIYVYVLMPIRISIMRMMEVSVCNAGFYLCASQMLVLMALAL